MRVLLTICGVVIVLLCGCNKTDPEDHPEYVGTWVHPNFTDDTYCDFIIKIEADGKCSYGTYGDYCNNITLGKCKINDKKIKIDGTNFKILEEPHEIEPLELATAFFDTIEVKTMMKLHWNEETLFFIGYDREFYKVE